MHKNSMTHHGNKKTCTDCGELKHILLFAKKPNYHKTKTKYRNGICKACMSKRTMKWIEENRERFNEYQLNYWHKVKKYK